METFFFFIRIVIMHYSLGTFLKAENNIVFFKQSKTKTKTWLDLYDSITLVRFVGPIPFLTCLFFIILPIILTVLFSFFFFFFLCFFVFVFWFVFFLFFIFFCFCFDF